LFLIAYYFLKFIGERTLLPQIGKNQESVKPNVENMCRKPMEGIKREKSFKRNL
jgi:hypothetical protein